MQCSRNTEKASIFLATLTLLLFLAAYFPVFYILVQKWARSEEYTHAFFTVPIILYLVWDKKDFLLNSHGISIALGLPILILSTIFYLIALQIQVPTISSLAMVASLLSVLIFLVGFRALKELMVPIILLLIIIPIPNQLYSTITLPLQLKVSKVSEAIIRLMSIPVLREGNIIHIPEKTFQVVEACSGLRSMITLLTLSLIMGYFMLTRALSRWALIGLSIPIAFLVNVIRVIILVSIYHYFHIDLSIGTTHTILGLSVFVIAMILLFFSQRILEKWEMTETKSSPSS